MKLSDYDFDLPDGLIATRPARPRSAARLLVANGAQTLERRVSELPELLRAGDRLVLNDTKVMAARLFGQRIRQGPHGTTVRAKVEVTLMQPDAAGGWQVMAKPLRKLRPGDELRFPAELSADVAEVAEGRARLMFSATGTAFEAALDAAGTMPLPPYIEALRPADAADRVDYQTVWARHLGAVAAPTASLHFDRALLTALAARGVRFTHVTLHVGAGTFLPVKVEDISRHKMHAEWGEVSAEASAEINATRAQGGRIIAVGTTALRLLESAAAEDGRLAPWRGMTDIFIRPGYRFRITDALMTNFHLPKSTLLMLVSALMGRERIRALYAHAIAGKYRFFSYGDASLLIPEAATRPQVVAGETAGGGAM